LNLVKIKKRFLTKAMFLVSPKHIFNFKWPLPFLWVS
jgi:hypothetical protein